MTDAIASPEMGEASPLIYHTDRRGKRIYLNRDGIESLASRTLYQFNTLVPESAKYPRIQMEPSAEFQTWGYDDDTGMLLLLFRSYSRLSIALAYCDATGYETTINRHSWVQHQKYLQDRTMRLTSPPNVHDEIDESGIVWNTGRTLIKEYLAKGYLWVPDEKTNAMLHAPFTNENYTENVSFLVGVTLAISEVESQWSGKPKIDEVNAPIDELPEVASPPSFIRKIIAYCLYGGPLLIAGWPTRWLFVLISAPIPLNWFWRGILIATAQSGYKLWKRYQIGQFERDLFAEESELAREEAVYLLERKSLNDESDIRSSDDFTKQKNKLAAKQRGIMFHRKELDLRKRNFYIRNLHGMSRNKRNNIQRMLTGGF